jgi:hypothetical protein
MLTFSRTKPFRQLQAGIGRSTHRLNTIVVGLELVALGGNKPEYLPINWNKPVSPGMARQAADQAKNFALVSATVYGTDLFDTFLRNLAAETWLGFRSETVHVVGRHGSGPGGHEYSMRERALTLYTELGFEADMLPSTLELLARWRNYLVHGSYGKERHLAKEVHDDLIQGAECLYDEYSGIDVGLTLKSFEDGGHPTRKEVTVLLACAQNLARKIDEAAIRRALPNEAAMEATADRFLGERWRQEASDRSGWLEFCDTWSKAPQVRAKIIVKVLGQLAITPARNPVSPVLTEAYIRDLACLNREDAATRLQLAT